MTKPGPPPKPEALRKLEGDRSNRPPKAPEVQIERAPSAKDPPEILDEVGAHEWRLMYPILQRCGLLSQADLRAFTVYCEIVSRWEEATRELKKVKMVKTPNNHVQASPWFSIQARCADQMKAFLIEFGITPAARARIAAQMTPPRAPQGAETEGEEAPPQIQAGKFTGLIGRA